MRIVRRKYLHLFLIFFIFLMMITVFFFNRTYSTDNSVIQTPMKRSFEEEREHGYCSDSHPTRGNAACPNNGIPRGPP